MSSLILLPELSAGKQTVTAGLPSVDPVTRAQRDYNTHQRHRSEMMVAEASAKQSAMALPDGGRSVTDPLAQLGRPLHSRDIIKRLLKLNPNLLFERSIAMPDVMGIYMAVDHEKRFLFGFEFGYSPEFTINDIDEATGNLRRQVRGWRKVLSNLIRMRLVTKASAEVMFDIPSGPQSERWQLLVN